MAGTVQSPHRTAGLLAVAPHRFAGENGVAELRHDFRDNLKNLRSANAVNAMSDARKNTRLAILPEYAVERAWTSVLRQFGSEYGMSSRFGDEGVDDVMRLRRRGDCGGGGERGHFPIVGGVLELTTTLWSFDGG